MDSVDPSETEALGLLRDKDGARAPVLAPDGQPLVEGPREPDVGGVPDRSRDAIRGHGSAVPARKRDVSVCEDESASIGERDGGDRLRHLASA